MRNHIHSLVQHAEDDEVIALDPVENKVSADRHAAVSGADVPPRVAQFRSLP